MIGIKAADIDWRKVWPALEVFEGLSGGCTTVEALAHEIDTGMRQLWVCGDWQAVVLTSVHPDCVTIDFCLGVEREDWQEQVDAVVCAWARSLGKSRVKSTGRPGWTKFARAMGYRETQREFEKEVGHG
jgi:hypothetical protein